ncbi:unnamed protein product, partial [Mesorhabditis spiculigera]
MREEPVATVGPEESWLKTAKFVEVLASDTSHKSLFILLRQESTGDEGIMLLNKSPFEEDPAWIDRFQKTAALTQLSKNDIFGNYDVSIPSELNVIKSQLIYPVNDKLKAKYRADEKFVITETPDDYRSITVEYINKFQLNLGWVYNLLRKEAEAERIIYEDPDPHNGFILAPDIKWDGVTIESLYVLSIIHRKGVKSVRDLTANDLPMLENMRDKCLKTINEKYGLRADQVRAYFHYQPSFYHLHVHFVNLKYDAPACQVLSAISLDDVINNIRLLPDYYQRATLSFTRKRGDNLLQMYVEAGRNAAVQ